MSPARIRSFLALLVVGTFMFITGFMAIFPLVSEAKVGLNDYADFFSKTASVYTGIIGVIIGYYFGRGESGKDGAVPRQDGAEKTTAA